MRRYSKRDLGMYVGKALAAFCLYFAAIEITGHVPFADAELAPIWFPAGIGLFLFLRWGVGIWPGVFAACMMDGSAPWGRAVAISVANTATPLASAYLLRRLRTDLSSVSGLLSVIGVGGVATAGATAIVFVFYERVAGIARLESPITECFRWIAGDLNGVLLLTPLLLTWSKSPLKKVLARKWEAAVAFSALLATTALIFGSSERTGTDGLALSFLLFPLYVWVALRLGVAWTGMAVLLTSCLALWQTAHGNGPFQGETYGQSVTWLHVFIATSAGSSLLLATAIEEKHSADDALKTREERLELLGKATNDVVWDWDLTTGRLWRGTGFWQSGNSFEVWRSLVHPEDVDRVHTEFRRVLAAREPVFASEYRFTSANGEYAHVLDRGHIIYDECGNPTRAIGVMMDITDRKRMESLKVELASIIESSQDAIATIGLDGVIRSWNAGAEATYGYPAEEAIGRNISMLAPPDKMNEPLELVARTITGERVHKVEAERRRKDARRIDVSVTVSPLKAPDGRILGVSAVSRDVTEARRSAEVLRKSEEKYRTIFDNNPQPMWLFDDRTLRFLDVNEAAVEKYGYSREEFLSMTILDIRAPEHQALMAEQAATSDLPYCGTWKHETKNGKALEVEIHSNNVRFNGTNARIVMVNDVSERRQLESQLQQAQKMETVGRLAGGIAHDFNNLLMVMRSHAELAGNMREPTSLTRHTTAITQAVDRAASLTGQLLAFSRRQHLVPTRVCLNTLLKDLEKILPSILGEDILIDVQLENDLCHVEVDRAQVEQVVLNLCVNARDAMREGGMLTIKTSNVELATAEAGDAVTIPPGRYVVLTVIDTGVGMSDEVKAHVFEPFFTTKVLGKGTGLGLASVYGIVRQSGGYIGVASRPGHGSTFTIHFPAKTPRPSTEEGAAPAISPTGSETILLVEDEQQLRESIAEFLTEKGYTVLQAANGAEAMQIAGPSTRFDLLLTDVVMPGMRGTELGRKLNAAHPDMQVLFMTGYSDRVVDVSELEGRSAVLHKPFTLASMARAVRALLGDKNRYGEQDLAANRDSSLRSE